MSKKNWIYLVLVVLAVIVLPGGFLLAGYIAKKKLTADPDNTTTPAVDPSTIPDSDGSNDTTVGDGTEVIDDLTAFFQENMA